MSISKELIRQARALQPKKGLSQNFLVDEAVLRRIAQAADTSDKAVPIVEIGAGGGFLTRLLLETGHPVTAIEVDQTLAPVLRGAYGDNPRFRLIAQDVRQVDLGALLGDKGVVVGNLPYHLTGPILFRIAGEMADVDYPLRRQMDRAVLMVQKEVAERLLAQPGDTAYSQLTVQVQFWFTVTPVVVAPRDAFFPSPAVDSMVVCLAPRPQPAVAVQDVASLSRIVKVGFMHRRKTLYNNLKISSLAPEETLRQAFDTVGIAPLARPQELSLQQFGALSDALALSG